MPRPKNRTVNKNRGRDQFVGDGPITINNNALSESILEKLTPYIATNALHNAKARANRRACLEGTRGGFIEKLGRWIEEPEENGRVFWVRGGAGVGKTAVAQTLCEKYSQTENSKGLLAAAYFFSRNDASRNSMDRFVPTIAYQLARSLVLQPHLADAISTAVLSDPGIVGADWDVQFNRLVREPCTRIDSELWRTLPRVVIIDGLDECMDIRESQAQSQGGHAWRRDGQVVLLKIIQRCMTTPSPIPLRFLIFSRPEHTISNLLHTALIPDLEQTDMHELRIEADGDIYLYLVQEFARLVAERRDAGLDATWPGEEAIQQLTRMSDGHFIYVVTAVKYVMDDDPSSHPQERLDIILRPKASTYPDFSPLDELYLHILQPFIGIREQLLLPLLQLIITPPNHSFIDHATLQIPHDTYRSRRVLAELLNQVDSRHVSIILSRLRSVLYVPDDEHSEIVSVLHATFSDFLTDQRRSKDFHVKSMSGPRYLERHSQSSLRTLKHFVLWYENDRDCFRTREPPAIGAWAFNAWYTLVEGIYHGFGVLGRGAESLQAVDEFDVYRYVNMLNDRNYIRPLLAYHYSLNDDTWGAFIATNLLFLRQVYAFLTFPPEKTVTWQLYIPSQLRCPRSDSKHNRNGLFYRFFEQDCVAVIPKRHRKLCFMQLKLLIGCLWDPIDSRRIPLSYCGSILPFPHGDGEDTFLKILPYDPTPPSTLVQSMTVEDVEIWRLGRGSQGNFESQQVTIVPTANGDFGWIAVPSSSSDLHEWMASLARRQVKLAKEKEATRKRANKKQGAMRKRFSRVAVTFRQLLHLDPGSEEEGEEEGEWKEFLKQEEFRRRDMNCEPNTFSNRDPLITLL